MLPVLLSAVCLASPNPASINEEVETLDEVESGVRLGRIVFDSRLPAEIQVDNNTVAQLFAPGRLIINATVGPHELQVLTNGTPRTGRVEVPHTGAATVVIGRTGLTTGRTEDEDDADGAAKVEFRVAGDQDVLVQLADDRYRIDAHGQKGVVVPVGSYRMSVRSGNGTVVWASGRLELHQATDVVIQLAEGRMPEVSGGGSSFHPGG
ncbi:MAG: hypothetical protein H6737_00660 [Alphaproteobacteria bacterium]|nr:hypothetical protein [Alphaproteobacteria bacterium]